MPDKNHENTEELTSSRRTALKQIGRIGALSSIGLSGVAAAKNGNKKGRIQTSIRRTRKKFGKHTDNSLPSRTKRR
jgi:hypothetical protein